MNFNETDGFTKDFKRLLKRYRSLSGDLLEFKKLVSDFPLGSGKNFTTLHAQEKFKVLKARFFCQSLKRTSLRVIYAYLEQEQRIEFVELYFKGDKENEDRQRIRAYLKDNES